MARPRKPRKPSTASVKAAAARAEARSAGEEIAPPKVDIDPKIIPAAAIKAKTRRRRRRVRYSEPLAKAICKMLGRGHTLTSICKRPLMPHEDTVLDWALDPDHPFSRRYARAREVGYLRMGDQIIDIADDSEGDLGTRMSKDGRVETYIKREVIDRARLRIDTRKWLLPKVLPRFFGDTPAGVGAVQADASGPDTAPQDVGRDHLEDIAARFQNKAQPAKSAPPPGSKANGKASGLH